MTRPAAKAAAQASARDGDFVSKQQRELYEQLRSLDKPQKKKAP